MATGTGGLLARVYHHQTIHFLRRGVSYADNGTVLVVGVLPANAVIIKALSGVYVTTAFNAGTGNVIDIGTADDGDYYGTDLALGSIGFVTYDEAVSPLLAAETTITATIALSGTAASAGEAEIIIAYVPDTDK